MAFKVSVPFADGIPSVLRPDGFGGTVQVITSDLVDTEFAPATWGIFLGGTAVVTAETVVSFDYRNESAISDYPVERGAFESFDKVAVPYNARVRFSSGGSAAVREALLSSIAAISDDLNLYDVVTPEATYSNANITHYDYQRSNERGRSLLVVDVWLEEIRQNATLAADSTVAPSGADPVNGGTVQPVSPGLSSQGFGTSTGFSGVATDTTTSPGLSSGPSGGFASSRMLT